MVAPIIKIKRRIKESNVLFKSESSVAITRAIETIKFHRMDLESYINVHPLFRYTLQPYPIGGDAPMIVKIMSQSCNHIHVGPMAAVAGALADLAVESMVASGAKIAIVENGGEVSASSEESFSIGLYAGNHPLSNKIGFIISPCDCPIGVGTSSATVGHAISFGEADSATVFAGSSALADAAATAICNAVDGKDVEASVQRGLDFADEISGVRGALIIRGKYVGSVGLIPRLAKVGNRLRRGTVSLTELFNNVVY